MKSIPLILATVMLPVATIGYGQSEKSAAIADRNPPTNATPMKTGVQRFLNIGEITADQVDTCKKLFAAVPAVVEADLKAAHIRNMTCFLKEIDGKHYIFNYLEYDGKDLEHDMGPNLFAKGASKSWGKSLLALISLPGKQDQWSDVEEVFFTAGAADVVPTAGKYARTGMITGLKPEKEAEYRTLHATTWPGVLRGIKNCNYRDFSIKLVGLEGKLYLIGYLEYDGKDPDADAAAGKALPVNKRWWKFTDACQQPLPAAAAKGEIWDGMTEIYHLD